MSQRIAIANDFVRRFKFRIPMLVDDMDNRIENLYSAWPERIYIVDETGRIAYKGGLGPFKFNPGELEKWLAKKFPPQQATLEPEVSGSSKKGDVRGTN